MIYAIHIWSIYTAKFLINIIHVSIFIYIYIYCHSTHPFTMEEKRWTLCKDIKRNSFHKILSKNTIILRRQVICNAVNILYYSKCIRFPLFSVSIFFGGRYVSPLILVLFAKIKAARRPEGSHWRRPRFIAPERPVVCLETFSRKKSHGHGGGNKQTHTARNCITVWGQQVTPFTNI